MKKRFYRLLFFLLFISMFCVAVIAIPNLCMIANGSENSKNVFYHSSEDKYDCILVLGAGLRNDGTPSDMLADRLETAIKLYNQGYSDIILLSGDRSGNHYDEASAMKNYCLERGISSENILCDNFGFSTYESIYNTSQMKDMDKVIVVTQKYHLYRALYIAEKMDIDVCGASADIRSYRAQIFRDIREIFARTKDFYKVIFFK